MLDLRTVSVREDGCFSAVCWFGRPFAVSVERTFENLVTVLNDGVYDCVRSYYNKGRYPTFEIAVEGHTRVLFHKGNLEIHSEACVVMAESFGMLDGSTAVMDSKGGFDEFMALARGLNTFKMRVTGRRELRVE